MQENLYFATNRGIYRAHLTDSIALHEALDVRVHQIKSLKTSLLAATEEGLFKLDQNGKMESLCRSSVRPTLLSLLTIEHLYFSTTNSRGILVCKEGNWSKVEFAKKSMNLFSSNNALLSENIPVLGAMDGSILLFYQNRWARIFLGEWPVTAVAAQGDILYAWTNGGLLQIQPKL